MAHHSRGLVAVHPGASSLAHFRAWGDYRPGVRLDVRGARPLVCRCRRTEREGADCIGHAGAQSAASLNAARTAHQFVSRVVQRSWITGRRASQAVRRRGLTGKRCENTTMFDSRFSDKVVARPAMCPFCKSKSIGTLAKVITVTSFWRCRQCEGTWTIASLASSSARPG